MFQDITIKWDGGQYTIPAKRMLRAISVIEEHVTLKELHEMTAERRTLQLAKIAGGFGALLRYLGVQGKDDEGELTGQLITDEQVYESMFSGVDPSNPGALGSPGSQSIILAVTSLLAIMTPPTQFLKRQQASSGGAEQGGNASARPTRAGGQSSKRTRSGSGRGGTSRKNSGASTQPSSGG